MIAEELRQLLKGEVLTDTASRDTYSRDYSIFHVVPQIIVCPADEDDVRRLITYVAKKREHGDHLISLTARSAGTDMTGGPLSESIVVSFTEHLNHITELTDTYVRSEPGVYFRNLEKQLAPRNLLFPSYPASKDICAIGGMVSNNSGGEKTLSYGKTADYVEGVRMILRDGQPHYFEKMTALQLAKKIEEQTLEGELYRKLYRLIEDNYDDIQRARPNVSKNSSGYALWDVWDRKTFDMTRLFVGAQGTLGIMTEAKLRLAREKPHHGLGVIFLRDMKQLPKIITEVLALHPEEFESYDDRTLEVALRFLPDLVRSMKVGLLKLMWQFWPEFLMVLRGGFPKMVLLVEFSTDTDGALDIALAKFKSKLAAIGARVRIITHETEQKKYWTVRRKSFALLHDHSKDKSTVPFIDDIIVRPDRLQEFLPRVNQILDRYKSKMIYTITGHVGDGNFHIIPLMDLRDPEVHRIIPIISKEIHDLVKEFDGSITAEHNDGLIRTPYLKQFFGEKIVHIFEQVKDIFDPDYIFNPRKKVYGDMAWIAEHVSKENS